MEPLNRLTDVLDRYDALLCDVWGVVHDGRRVFPGVADTLRAARRSGTVVLLLTNVPRPSGTMPRALARLDFPDDAWDAVVTSGDATRVELARRAPGPAHRIGRQTDDGLWDGLGMSFGGLAEARFLAIAGMRGPDDSPDAYGEVLRAAVARDLELVCANPDITVQAGDRLQWSAGAVAAEYAALGGRVVLSGKPHDPIYRRAFAVLEELVGAPVPRDRVLAIGDGIATDLLGADRQGIDSLFVATGVHGTSLLRGEVESGPVDLDRASAAVAAEGTRATYVMPRLA